MGELRTRYRRVFDPENADPIADITVSLELKEGERPVFHRAYTVPYAMLRIHDEKLDELIQKGHIYQVKWSRWASPYILVQKPKGYRLCPDMKKTVNPKLHIYRHKPPIPEDIFSGLAGATCFTVIDLTDAFTQLSLDEASQEMLTIITHRGLFRYRRLIYGVASAPGLFQHTMDYILQGIPNVYCFVDDILIPGTSFKTCLHMVNQVLERLERFNVRIRPEKCKWFESEVEYLGHVLSAAGRRPTASKVDAIENLKTPSTVREVRHVIGVVRFYDSYIPHASTILKPLRYLQRKLD